MRRRRLLLLIPVAFVLVVSAPWLWTSAAAQGHLHQPGGRAAPKV